MIILRKQGASSFLELTDTPTTYSGFENSFLKVNAPGNSIEFVPINANTQAGIVNIPAGTSSVSVDFSNQYPSIDYILAVSLENKIDVEPSVYPILVKDKTINGFDVYFSGEIDSSNYYLNWKATFSDIEVYNPGGSGITELSEDSSPELGGDLDIGSHLVMLDVAPSGINLHGYEVGYSGEASEMYVSDNPTGFACPLYMQSNGNWGAACAASGVYNMPCAALALSEEYGEFTKIFWKGNIRKEIWNWTPGNKIYVSTVEGALTNVKPNGGSWPQVVGIAISPDTIRFDPDLSSENTN